MKQHLSNQRQNKSCYFRFLKGKNHLSCSSNPLLIPNNQYFMDRLPHSRLKNKAMHSHEKTFTSFDKQANITLSYVKEILLKKYPYKGDKQKIQDILPVSKIPNVFKPNFKYMSNSNRSLNRTQSHVPNELQSRNISFTQTNNSTTHHNLHNNNFSNQLISKQLNQNLKHTLKVKIKDDMKKEIRKQLKIKAQSKRPNQIVERAKMSRRIVVSHEKGKQDTIETYAPWQTEEDEKQQVFILKSKC